MAIPDRGHLRSRVLLPVRIARTQKALLEGNVPRLMRRPGARSTSPRAPRASLLCDRLEFPSRPRHPMSCNSNDPGGRVNRQDRKNRKTLLLDRDFDSPWQSPPEASRTRWTGRSIRMNLCAGPSATCKEPAPGQGHRTSKLALTGLKSYPVVCGYKAGFAVRSQKPAYDQCPKEGPQSSALARRTSPQITSPSTPRPTGTRLHSSTRRQPWRAARAEPSPPRNSPGKGGGTDGPLVV